ncbi:hypothetical protein SBOR_9329 [Sclerotinia borealis F-4128]|uniref:Small ribosomal subunit protein uS4m n=1 Tax=Sclerotinia borealis (strain F-4128) TaxID=1432307 RepID=W9C5V3_SCLBF|nr:hypothetical protein SBOR_9329 [Sclerotinia borealis F-4128]
MRSRFHQLKKVKIRQSWNKFNLYNLARYKPRVEYGTFFQQKWKAKSASRAYHGEQIREGQWTKMFRPRAAAVIPMDGRYLAEHDGSELAAGRGSGLDTAFPKTIHFDRNQIPYMSMVYAPMERRLDTAIFRSLFASSTRQARQFVVHGKVKVNGKKMPYPGYLLNPGDMFQVDIERVLFATGAPKTNDQIKSGRGLRRSLRSMNDQKTKNAAAKREKETVAAAAKAEGNETASSEETPESKEKDAKDKLRMEFRTLSEHADVLAADSKNAPSGKRKIALRKLKREIRTTLSQVNRKTIADLNAILKTYTTNLAKSEDLETLAHNGPKVINAEDTHDYQKKLKLAIQRARENPIDESKPYMTPWQPRPYMSAFAFIPRYLEVNQKICSAVYLRHPVARPGFSEVPSPFPMDVLQLAHNWYLRRR